MPVKESQEPKELVEFVSDEQLKSFIEEWDRYDKDQNGTITVQEFLEGEKAYENALTGEEMSEEALKDKLEFWNRTKDGNNDGEVGWYEFANSKALLVLDEADELHKCLTEAEQKDARAAFNLIDTDLSGGICETEARKYYEAKYARDVDNNLRTQRDANLRVEQSVQSLMRSHNRDSDDLIDFDEFLREEAKSIIADRLRESNKKESLVSSVPVHAEEAEDVTEMAQLLSEPQIEHAKIKFDEIDTDDSGNVDLKELKKVFKSLGLDMKQTTFNKEIKKAFKQADTDGSQSLDFEEFKAVYNYLYVKNLDMSAFC